MKYFILLTIFSLFILSYGFGGLMGGGGFGGMGGYGGYGGFGGMGSSVMSSSSFMTRYYGNNYMGPGYGSYGGMQCCYHMRPFGYGKHLTISSNANKNQRISEFESMVNSEKMKAKDYLILRDKCNVMSELNTDNLSKLLDTKVMNIYKWSYNENNCALIELNDRHYNISRCVRRSLGFDTKHSLANSLRFITINKFPKMLIKNSDKYNNKENNEFVYQLNSRRKESNYLKVNDLKTCFKTNEDILSCLLADKQITELDHKLRYYIVAQMERYICQSNFRDYQILPFGSSTAGLGTPNSDLDLVLIPRVLAPDSESKYKERQRLQTNLNLIADLLQYSVPFYSHFSRVLKARIPIIKFGFDLAPIDIDLSIQISSYSVHHGFYMSAFLRNCIQMNPCVRDMILIVKIWAKQHKLLKPKNWSTNTVYNGFTSFQLTALVVYFLQKLSVVPPMNQFLNNPNKPFESSKSDLNCIQLLAEFFDFVLNLQFEWEAISILNGESFLSSDNSSIYMQNPFDIGVNMCQNITSAKLEKFLERIQFCSEIMRTKDFNLADIFDQDLRYKNNNRIKVGELFADDSD